MVRIYTHKLNYIIRYISYYIYIEISIFIVLVLVLFFIYDLLAILRGIFLESLNFQKYRRILFKTFGYSNGCKPALYNRTTTRQQDYATEHKSLLIMGKLLDSKHGVNRMFCQICLIPFIHKY